MKRKAHFFKRGVVNGANTFITGGGLQMTTVEMFSFITGIPLSTIQNYQVIGPDISCFITDPYILTSDTFNPLSGGFNTGEWNNTFGDTRTIIGYDDPDGLCTGLTDQTFIFQSNFQNANFPAVGFTFGGSQNFRATDLRIGNFPNINSPFIGVTSVSNGNFTQITNGNLCTLTLPIFYQTNNGGSIDADLVELQTNGAFFNWI